MIPITRNKLFAIYGKQIKAKKTPSLIKGKNIQDDKLVRKSTHD